MKRGSLMVLRQLRVMRRLGRRFGPMVFCRADALVCIGRQGLLSAAKNHRGQSTTGKVIKYTRNKQDSGDAPVETCTYATSVVLASHIERTNDSRVPKDRMVLEGSRCTCGLRLILGTSIQ